MKKIFMILGILTLLLLTACATQEDTVVEEFEQIEELEPEPTPEPIVEEPVEEVMMEESEEIVEEESLSDPFYRIKEGETVKILGKQIHVTSMSQPAIVDLTIDGEVGKLKNTKEEEIINMLFIETNSFDYEGKGSPMNSVVLKVSELELEPNQYFVKRAHKITAKGKDIILEESKSNGYISVSVFNQGTRMGAAREGIASGKTEELNGLEVTNVMNYYKNSQYAVIEVN